MRIKKKELRKGLAQLPINYPDPEVLPDALPGGRVDFSAAMVQVEWLCKRLAHNEAGVREAALAALPRYLTRLTLSIAAMEDTFQEEMAQVRAYFLQHPKALNPYHYENLPRALQAFRERAQQQERQARRRAAVASLHLKRQQEEREKASRGRFLGDRTPSSSNEVAGEENEEEKEAAASAATTTTGSGAEAALSTAKAHRDMYQTWMLVWCDLELVFLKLCRGIFFCLWHSDKPLVQLACAQRIADLLHAPCTLRCKNLFYSALLRVLSREWPTIDRYRMDKYLALVRKIMFEWVKLIKNLEETEEIAPSQGDTLNASRAGRTVSAGVAVGKSKSSAVPLKSSKRMRHAEVDPNPSEESVGITVSLTATGTSHQYIEQYYSNCPTLRQVLLEFLYIFQEQIFPKSTSVGLTMHICDVAFDEFSKACVSPKLFVTLSAGIPLYAMSQGNFVEKRVLDNFFPPLASGVYAKQREEQLFKAKKQLIKSSRKCNDKKANGKKNADEQESGSEEDLHKVAKREAEHDAKAVLLEIAKCCKLYAVARGTAYAVRVMFSEAEMVIQQAAEPDAYENLTPHAQRRRLEKEIDEVNETRRLVKTERAAAHQMKRKGKKQALITKIKQQKAARGAHKSDEGKGKSVKEVLEKGLKKKKKVPRDTKRKKHYQLTKKDLYGNHDDDDINE